ncbi:hypothetical protein [Niabella sp.]|uniref:hypothetical protein n=1 Tax=Niabella sp. TaxID=1962976 RepID=UPI0026134D1A|nr:hypothetical protein [Niabella sp.]
MKKFLLVALVAAITTNAFAQSSTLASIDGGANNSAGQNRSANFGEKVAGGLQAGTPAVVTGVSGIGGGTKSGGAVSSSYAAGRLSMTPTTTKQTQGMSFGEKVAQGMTSGNSNSTLTEAANQARPGTPIGGIVVKGGKNPGGNMLVTISNEKGLFELNNLAPGNYRFTLVIQETSQGKSISEKGVKRAAPAMADPGQPIKGIIVKGGKNPGGAITQLRVSQNGEIGFEVLEAGSYQFLIQTGDDLNENNTDPEAAKVVEKATSGLKDTLKTNV